LLTVKYYSTVKVMIYIAHLSNKPLVF
jgi:hypothetical protein